MSDSQMSHSVTICSRETEFYAAPVAKCYSSSRISLVTIFTAWIIYQMDAKTQKEDKLCVIIASLKKMF